MVQSVDRRNGQSDLNISGKNFHAASLYSSISWRSSSLSDSLVRSLWVWHKACGTNLQLPCGAGRRNRALPA